MTKFSYKQSLLKAVKYVILFGLPVIVDQFIISYPAVAQLTVGGLLVILVNYLKVEVGLKIV